LENGREVKLRNAAGESEQDAQPAEEPVRISKKRAVLNSSRPVLKTAGKCKNRSDFGSYRQRYEVF